LFVGNYQGVFPPPITAGGLAAYLKVLTEVNVTQGGTADGVGAPKEPITFSGGQMNLLELDSEITRDRLIEALKLAFPQVLTTDEIDEVPAISLVLMNPPTVTVL
jgi:hypothetical protein